MVHHRHERGDRGDREAGPTLRRRVEHDTRVEAEGEGHCAGGDDGDEEMADEAGDVEEWRDAEHPHPIRQAHPVAVDLGVPGDVAVGVGGPLGQARGARGVDEEGEVAGRRLMGGRLLAAMAGQQRPEVLGPLAGDCGKIAEETRVVPRLEVEGRGRQHDARNEGPRLVRQGGDDVAIERVVADQGRRPRIGQDEAEFALAVHRVDRHHDAAGLPGGDHGDEEIGDVLEIDRQAVARRETPRDEGGGKRVAFDVDLAVGQGRVEIMDGRTVGRARDGGAEHRQRVGKILPRLRRHMGRIEFQPGLLVVDAHLPRPPGRTGRTGLKETARPPRGSGRALCLTSSPSTCRRRPDASRHPAGRPPSAPWSRPSPPRRRRCPEPWP